MATHPWLATKRLFLTPDNIAGSPTYERTRKVLVLRRPWAVPLWRRAGHWHTATAHPEVANLDTQSVLGYNGRATLRHNSQHAKGG
jgi:hypothetical protein